MDDGCQPIAIGRLSDSGDLKKTKINHKKKKPNVQQKCSVEEKETIKPIYKNQNCIM